MELFFGNVGKKTTKNAQTTQIGSIKSSLFCFPDNKNSTGVDDTEAN
jgi:hypothetical protein